MTSHADTAPGWREAVFNRRMLTCIFTGFASGLPLYVVIQLMQVWLREGGASLTEIGLFAFIQAPYILKFLWAPLMDRYVPPFLGRRRGWMVVTQVVLLLSIGTLGMFSPQEDLDAILGDLKNTKQHDFSKIQGRFKTRLSLSSANVDEVIKKRLLDKSERAMAPLAAAYEGKHDILRNQLSFVRGCLENRPAFTPAAPVCAPCSRSWPL